MREDLSHLSMDQEADEMEAIVNIMALAGLAVFGVIVGLSMFFDMV